MSKPLIVSPQGDPVTVDEATGAVVKVKDPVLEAARQFWDDAFDMEYLAQLFELFSQAVQQGASKEPVYGDSMAWKKAGCPIWNEKDTYDTWMACADQVVKARLTEELKKKIKENISIDPSVKNLIDAGEFEDLVAFAGRTLSVELAEIYEWLLRRSIETIEKYRKGKYPLCVITALWQKQQEEEIEARVPSCLLA